MTSRSRPLTKIVLIIIASLALASTSIPVGAHVYADEDGATVSWYPAECCHERDCRPVTSIKVAPHGLWMTTVDGLTILIGHAEKRRPSRDMRWHICIGPDDIDMQVFCIFEPANS